MLVDALAMLGLAAAAWLALIAWARYLFLRPRKPRSVLKGFDGRTVNRARIGPGVVWYDAVDDEEDLDG